MMHRDFGHGRLAAALTFLALGGCLRPTCPNTPLERFEPAYGYRFDSIAPGPGNTDDLFICVSFSGGGTRAAAFAYGVLEGLRDVALGDDADQPATRTLLDEVDMVSGVSGGSFTAMGLGLWGRDLFDGQFRERFLERNIQLALLLNLLKPRNLLRIFSIVLDRSDIAAYFYDEHVFDEQTYGDLLARNQRPFVVVNATDLTRRQRFAFTQDDFDLLGSDLTTLPVGWAVAASSAFPILLSPLRLQYFHGPPLRAAIDHVLGQRQADRPARHAKWAESLLLQDPQAEGEVEVATDRHKYLYLLDGGVADNLGVTYFIEAFRVGEIRDRIRDGRIRRLVVIIVDAATDPPEDLERKRASPGILKVGERTASTAIYAHSSALSALVRYALLEAEPLARKVEEQCRDLFDDRCPGGSLEDWHPLADVEGYVVDIDFYRVQDESLREDLLSLITSFFLPAPDVERLIRAGRRVTRTHPELKRLLEDLRTDAKNP